MIRRLISNIKKLFADDIIEEPVMNHNSVILTLMRILRK